MAERRPSVWIRIIIPLVLVATWLGVSAVGGPYFGRIEEVSEVDLTAFLPKSAEATQVSKKLGEFVSNDTLAAVVVYEAESGEKLSSTQSTEIEKVRATIASANGVEGELSPTLVSDDGKAAFIVAQASTEVGLKEVVGEIRATISEDTIEGTKGFVTGPAGFAADLNV
ncbi:MAG: hypothetical protein WBK76_01620, partial [Candidatus Saccharimonadales bacterium]